MSRIGKKPIPLPKGVTVKIAAGAVEVKGPKGTLHQPIPPGITFEQAGTELVAKTTSDDPQLGKFHGLARSLVANAVEGVVNGYKRELDIVGVGYRAELKGRQVTFALGYSHPIVLRHPGGHRHRRRQADARDGDRHRPAAGGPGRRQHPPHAQARPLQAEGRAVHRRSAEEEGRQDRRVEVDGV